MGPYLAVLSLAFVALAAVNGGWSWLMLWPAAAFGAIAAAYLVRAPGVFGKRLDGTVPWYRVAFVLPYMLFAWLILWRLRKGPRDPWNEIIAGVYLGRMPRAGELPPGTEVIVDLTAEFSADRAVKEGRIYIAVPTLDGTPPSVPAMRALLHRLSQEKRPMYVHCAAGYGRSATVVAALLMERGVAKDVGEALTLLRQRRRYITIRTPQRRALEQLRSANG